jgi:hypothetical protein
VRGGESSIDPAGDQEGIGKKLPAVAVADAAAAAATADRIRKLWGISVFFFFFLFLPRFERWMRRGGRRRARGDTNRILIYIEGVQLDFSGGEASMG